MVQIGGNTVALLGIDVGTTANNGGQLWNLQDLEELEIFFLMK